MQSMVLWFQKVLGIFPFTSLELLLRTVVALVFRAGSPSGEHRHRELLVLCELPKSHRVPRRQVRPSPLATLAELQCE